MKLNDKDAKLLKYFYVLIVGIAIGFFCWDFNWSEVGLQKGCGKRFILQSIVYCIGYIKCIPSLAFLKTSGLYVAASLCVLCPFMDNKKTAVLASIPFVSWFLPLFIKKDQE